MLLRGINSSVRSLRALMRGLLRSRVRPYYLFQGDTVIGTDHLRTPVEAAMELYRGLRGWMNSMAVPMLVLDAPGGHGKVPLIPSYIEQLDAERVIVRTYRGERVEYPQPRERDCTVPYDAIQFAGTPADDDREGSRRGVVIAGARPRARVRARRDRADRAAAPSRAVRELAGRRPRRRDDLPGHRPARRCPWQICAPCSARRAR